MKAVFLDRDGTINREEPNYLTDIRKLKIFKEAFKAIQLLNQHQFKTIVVTNQSCVNKGLLKEEKLHKINDLMKKRLSNKKAFLDSIYYCPHTPFDQCSCRKPKAGMFEQAVKDHAIDLEKSFMVGDRMFDMESGKNLEIKTILVLTGAGKETQEVLKTGSFEPHFIANHILEAVEWIIEKSKIL